MDPEDKNYYNDEKVLEHSWIFEHRGRNTIIIDKEGSEFKVKVTEDGDGNLLVYVFKKTLKVIVVLCSVVAVLYLLGVLSILAS